MKVFLAHSKGTTDLQIQFWRTAITRWFGQRGEVVEVVPTTTELIKVAKEVQE